jgi:signal transduction histidine kinase/DNA-binding NarL/FixJ family response regulator
MHQSIARGDSMKRGPGLDLSPGSSLAADLARRERELAALSAIATVASTAEDPLAVLDEVASHLMALLPSGQFATVTLSDGGLLLRPLMPLAEPVRLLPQRVARTPLDAALRERRIARGRARDSLHPAFVDAPAWLVTPLVSGDRVLGAFLAAAADEGVFDDRHARVMEQAALQVAIAMEHATLLDEMRRHALQIETLREVVESISSELDQERLLHRIVAAAVELLRAYGGAVGLAQPNGDALSLAALVNIPEEPGTLIPAGTGVMGLALSERGPVVVRDYADLPAPIPLEALYHLAPWLAVPIFWQGAITGVFGICAADPSRQFTDDDVQVLTLFAKHAAIAIENARLYQQSRELAVTEERNRLAREIHDTLAQSLTGMILQIQAVDELLEREPVQARAELQSLQHLARTALDDARRSVWGLRPPILEEATLGEALERRLQEASRQAAFTGRFSTSGRPRPLTPAIEAGIYRIAQESITNVVRHAQAKVVVVQLRFDPGELVLVVQDDGRGIAGGQQPGANGGYGLTSMQERARLMGGAMTLESEEGRGTRVEVRVPYLVSQLDIAAHGPREAGPGPENWPIRVLVADDHDVARHGIIRMIESNSDIVVIAEAATGQEALARARHLRPDVALMDVQMPGMSGIDVIRAINSENLGVRAIILTTYARDDVIFDGIRAGARGFLLKDISAEELARAVRIVNQGQSLLQPVVATRLVEQIGRMARPQPDRDQLTPRELDVLRLLVEGARNKEISARLHISHGTVRFHVGNIFQKLGVSSRTEAVRLALQDRIVT